MHGEVVDTDSVPDSLGVTVRFRLGAGSGDFNYGLPDRSKLYFPLLFRSF
ncbi:MAG TPA: hypothetical protein VGE07_11195 [Herpetosiphonaceae bacterium]